MIITFILPSYPSRPVGGFKVVYEYANLLIERGHYVHIVYPRFLKNASSKYTIKKLLVRAREKFFKVKSNWFQLNPLIKCHYVREPTDENVPCADAIFATAWETAEYVNGLSARCGVKFYLIQHFESWSGKPDRVEATWRFDLNKIVISKWLYRKAFSLGIPQKQVTYIPNAIDHTKFKIKVPICDRPFTIAMMYSNIRWKRSADGVRTIALARQKVPGIKAILFGAHARPAGIPQWMSYYQNPSLDTLVNKVYNSSSIYLCTSLTEGWHLPPAEAMACGCAVVSTDIDGVKDYAEHGKTALLSPLGDIDLIAKNIIMLLENPSLRFKIAFNGNQKIQEFTLDKNIICLENYISEKVAIAKLEKHF